MLVFYSRITSIPYTWLVGWLTTLLTYIVLFNIHQLHKTNIPLYNCSHIEHILYVIPLGYVLGRYRVSFAQNIRSLVPPYVHIKGVFPSVRRTLWEVDLPIPHFITTGSIPCLRKPRSFTFSVFRSMISRNWFINYLALQKLFA